MDKLLHTAKRLASWAVVLSCAAPPALEADGVLGTAGFVQTDFGGGSDAADAVLIVDPTRVLAAGWSRGGAFGDFALARYTAVTPVELQHFSLE